MKLIALEITTWAGMSIGAEHYYGRLKFDGEPKDNGLTMRNIEVTKVIDGAEATILNIKDRCESYEAGDTVGRFNREVELIELGIKQVIEAHGKDIVVRLNCYTSAQPEHTVYAPENILEELNKIEIEWFEIWDNDWDAWENSEDELDPICDEWREVNKKYNIK